MPLSPVRPSHASSSHSSGGLPGITVEALLSFFLSLARKPSLYMTLPFAEGGMVSFPRLRVPQVPAQPLLQIPNLTNAGEVRSGPAWLHPAHLPLPRSRWWKAQNTADCSKPSPL